MLALHTELKIRAAIMSTPFPHAPNRTSRLPSLLTDSLASIRNHEYWTYTTWMKMGLGYRKTAFGPLWIMASPAVFVFALGFLFSKVLSVPREVYVPHLAIGYITWLFIINALNSAPNVFVTKRSEILQGQMRLTDLVLSNIFTAFLLFLHHLVIIAVVFLYFRMPVGLSSLASLLGVAILLVNAYWFYIFFGIVGARYRDTVEVIQAIARLFFFITPIIWVPEDGGGGALGAFLWLNPFYHYLEVVRAPLMGNPITPLTWGVVSVGTVVGLAVSALLYRRVGRQVPLWV